MPFIAYRIALTFAVLSFAQAALESVEVSYMAIPVPLLGNASRKCGSVVRRSIRIEKKKTMPNQVTQNSRILVTFFKKVMGGKKATLILGKKGEISFFVIHDTYS